MGYFSNFSYELYGGGVFSWRVVEILKCSLVGGVKMALRKKEMCD